MKKRRVGVVQVVLHKVSIGECALVIAKETSTMNIESPPAVRNLILLPVIIMFT